VWTLELAAAVAYERGLTAQRVSGVTICNTLARMGVPWRRATEWITSPDPGYARQQARRDRLTWCVAQAQARGNREVLLVWAKASWHDSQRVRTWMGQHHRHVKQSGHGVRLISALLPSKSPWLNPIEPTWLHGKRKVLKPDRLLATAGLAQRVCAVYDCPHELHLVTPPTVPKEAA
jgi:DDE superfamily endonuclease